MTTFTIEKIKPATKYSQIVERSHSAPSEKLAKKFIQTYNNGVEELNDYKFMCFNGQPLYMQLNNDYEGKHYVDFYDLEWNKMPFERIYPFPLQNLKYRIHNTEHWTWAVFAQVKWKEIPKEQNSVNRISKTKNHAKKTSATENGKPPKTTTAT